MSKRFGQNFLVNRRQREKILDQLALEPGSRVWEIGPGIGAMTGMAMDRGCQLTAFEIDHGFARILRRVYGFRPEFTLVEGDFLDSLRDRQAQHEVPDRIFGNLPYSAANAIIAAIIEAEFVPPRMVFTVQKEAARRICAVPGTKDYSAFSVLCSSACIVKTVFDIGAASFWPAPSVTSSVVVFLPRPEALHADDRLGFSAFVRRVFASRRKTMRNTLKGWMPGKTGSIPSVQEVEATPEDSQDTDVMETDLSVSDRDSGSGPAGDAPAILEELLLSLGKPADARAEILTPPQLAFIYGQLRSRLQPE